MCLMKRSVGLWMVVLAGCAMPVTPTYIPYEAATYEPASVEGNQCRNACVEALHLCVGSSGGASIVEICQGSYRGGLDLDQCFRNCERFYGGTYTPFESSRVEVPQGQKSESRPPGQGERGDVCEGRSDCSGQMRCVDGSCR